MYPEKFQLDKIQNGRLSAIIHFNIPYISGKLYRSLDHYYGAKCEVSGTAIIDTNMHNTEPTKKQHNQSRCINFVMKVYHHVINYKT